MIRSTTQESCDTILDKHYAANCILEWARTEFDVDLKPSMIADGQADEIEQIIKDRAKDNVTSKISLSLGEYLEDYEDPKTWDVQGLSKWAMSAFRVNLAPSKIKQQSPDEIEQTVSAIGRVPPPGLRPQTPG